MSYRPPAEGRISGSFTRHLLMTSRRTRGHEAGKMCDRQSYQASWRPTRSNQILDSDEEENVQSPHSATSQCSSTTMVSQLQTQNSEMLSQQPSQPDASQPSAIVAQQQQQQQVENMQMQAPQQPPAMRQGRGRGRGRSSRSRRGGSVTSGGRTEQTTEKIVIDSEVLIQMVHERPALWDQTDTQHANHTATRRLWEDIFIAIVERGNYVWEELEDWQKQSFGDQIKCRWSSFRDRFIRDVGAEAKTPSGSGTVPKRPYTYMEQLSFLRKCTDMRKTSSNVRERQTIVEAGELASGTGEQVASQSCPAPLPETSPVGSSSTSISAGCGSVIHQMRSGRRRQNDLEDLIRVSQDALIRLDQQMTGLRDEVTRLLRQQEGPERSTSHPSPSQSYLNSLAILMEQLPIERQFEFRQMTTNKMMELLARHNTHSNPQQQPHHQPQPYSQPTSQPQPYSQPPSQTQHYSQPISQPQPYSQPPSQTQPYSQPYPQPTSQPQPYTQPISQCQPYPTCHTYTPLQTYNKYYDSEAKSHPDTQQESTSLIHQLQSPTLPPPSHSTPAAVRSSRSAFISGFSTPTTPHFQNMSFNESYSLNTPPGPISQGVSIIQAVSPNSGGDSNPPPSTTTSQSTLEPAME